MEPKPSCAKEICLTVKDVYEQFFTGSGDRGQGLPETLALPLVKAKLEAWKAQHAELCAGATCLPLLEILARIKGE